MPTRAYSFQFYQEALGFCVPVYGVPLFIEFMLGKVNVPRPQLALAAETGFSGEERIEPCMFCAYRSTIEAHLSEPLIELRVERIVDGSEFPRSAFRAHER